VAAVVAIGTYELLMLAGAAITAMFLVSPAGQKASQEAARAASEALERARENAKKPQPDPEKVPPTVDPLPPTCTTDCPEKKKKPTCATEYPDLNLCSDLPEKYIHLGKEAAFKDFTAKLSSEYRKTARMEKTRAAEGGPCPGSGTHTAIRVGGEYLKSIVCCPCCTDTLGGPTLSTKCALV
jgi:hypothetical protein